MSWIFAAPPCDEAALRAQARRLLAGRPFHVAWLAEATAQHGPDLATAMAYEALLADPGNAELLAKLQEGSAEGLHLAIIPTMYHRERPEIGGDGSLVAAIATRLGAHVETVPVASLGAIAANAELIANTMRRWEAPRWLVTLSKGSADLKCALLREPTLWSRVAGWISLAGMPGGTPLAEARPGRPIAHALLRAWLAWRGADGAMLAEMGATGALSRAPLVPPTDLPVVNIVGLPLASHLRAPVDRAWRFLATNGPNDGCVPLAKALLPGRTIPLWGADHYLRTPELQPLLAGLLTWAAGHG